MIVLSTNVLRILVNPTGSDTGLIQELGTKNFNRIRIGICPESGKPKQVEKFVLQNFTKAEEKILKEVIEKVISGIKKAIAYSR